MHDEWSQDGYFSAQGKMPSQITSFTNLSSLLPKPCDNSIVLLYIEGYLYISSKGLVSAKHESQTSFTTLTACTSSLQLGRAITDRTARALTQFWNC